MSRRHLSQIACGALALAALAAMASAQTRFYGIGTLPGMNESTTSAVSRNGQYVIGTCRATGPTYEYRAFRWTEAGGLVPLPHSSQTATYSSANTITPDGGIIVGFDDWHACRWIGVDPPTIISSVQYSRAAAVSADGSVIAGTSGGVLFRWSEGAGLLTLGDVRGTVYDNYARDMSDDGSVVIGNAQVDGAYRGFRWTASTGFTAMGGASATGVSPSANAVSSDGSIVCGMTYTGTGMDCQAFRWTVVGGLEMLGDLPGGTVSGSAVAMTPDGEIIVGSGNGPAGYRPFIWTRAQGMRDLQAWLTDGFGVDLTGWQLTSAIGISGDGMVISGNGMHNGVAEGWVVHLSTSCQLEIIRQPIDRTVHSNDTFFLGMAVTGLRPVTYQWRRNGQPLTDGPGVSGSSTSSLTLSNLASSGTFDVTITNACGTIVTRTAHVTVVAPTTPIVAYVKADATGANDGASWESAFTSLQNAINTSVPFTQLWVARGTYGDRATIALRSDIAVYGGFAGTETTLNARNPTANPTIIDGQSAVRCVEAINCTETVLDGFTITRGLAGTDLQGAGLFVSAGSPRFAICAITLNSVPMVSGVSRGRGGGVFVTGSASPQFTDCSIAGNWVEGSTAPGTALGEGGGIAVENSSLTMTRCVIADNRPSLGQFSFCSGGFPSGGRAGGNAGGIRLENATLTLAQCLLRGNTAPPGGSGAGCGFGSANGGFNGGNGGAINAINSTTTAENTLCVDNTAGNGGNAGASQYLYPISSSGAGGSGGAIYATGGSVTLRNCTLAGNSAGRGGYGTNGGANAPSGAGGGIYAPSSTLTISNSILWDNTGQRSTLENQISPASASGIQWSCVQGLVPAPGSGNIAVDPVFASDSDRSLEAESPCIDAGNNAFAYFELDLAGRPRRVDMPAVADTGSGALPIVDMGAYEAWRCIADVDDGTNQGIPDGAVTIDDLLYYLKDHTSGMLAADVDDGSGTGRHDGAVTIDDALFFIQRYIAGC